MIIEFGHNFVKNGPIMDNKVLFLLRKVATTYFKCKHPKIIAFFIFFYFDTSLNWPVHLCATSDSKKIYTKIDGMN